MQPSGAIAYLGTCYELQIFMTSYYLIPEHRRSKCPPSSSELPSLRKSFLSITLILAQAKSSANKQCHGMFDDTQSPHLLLGAMTIEFSPMVVMLTLHILKSNGYQSGGMICFDFVYEQNVSMQIGNFVRSMIGPCAASVHSFGLNNDKHRGYPR